MLVRNNYSIYVTNAPPGRQANPPRTLLGVFYSMKILFNEKSESVARRFRAERRGYVMENMKYYLDTDHNRLMAYDRETEFFAEYIAANGEWVMSSISFMQFRHDYPYRAVSREEAAETAGGILPETLFRQYLDILRDNRGEK